MKPINDTPFSSVAELPFNIVSLRFHRNEMERDFDIWARRTQYIQARLALFAVGILYIVYAEMTPYVTDEETLLSVSYAMHLYLMVPLTIGASLLLGHRRLRDYFIPVTTIVVSVAFALYLYLMLRFGLSGFYAPEFYFMIVWIFTVTGFRFYYAITLVGAMVAVSLVALVIGANEAIGTQAFYTYLFWLFVALCLGVLSGHLIECWSKTNYCYTALLHRRIEGHIDEQARLKYLSEHDALTGAVTRSRLYEAFDEARASAKRSGQKIVWIFMDVDCFKRFNDTYGHAGGDQLLRIIVARIRNAIRKSDVVARIGGDEFIVMLCDVSSLEDAMKRVETLHKRIGKFAKFDDGLLYDFSTSMGVAVYPDHADDRENLTLCADRAMYVSKQEGRNRVTMYREG